jgi:hypothetical protein
MFLRIRSASAMSPPSALAEVEARDMPADTCRKGTACGVPVPSAAASEVVDIAGESRGMFPDLQDLIVVLANALPDM